MRRRSGSGSPTSRTSARCWHATTSTWSTSPRPRSCIIPQAMAALRAGKHVICEKPLAMTVAQADEMIAEAHRHDRLLVANLMQRYNPVSDAVGRLVEAKVLGEPLHGSFENYASDENLGPGHWFWDRSKSGGIFIEHGVHFFDLFAGWLGPGRVVAAAAGPAAGLVAAPGGARAVHGPVRPGRARQLLSWVPPDRPDGSPGAAPGLRARRRDAVRLGSDAAPDPRDRRRGPDPHPVRAVPRGPARLHVRLWTRRTERARDGTRAWMSTRCWSFPGARGRSSRTATASCSARCWPTSSPGSAIIPTHGESPSSNGRDSLAVACAADELAQAG